MTDLAPHRRGTTFERRFPISPPWTGDSFTGGVKFTLRRSIPEDSSVLNDDDAVDQATAEAGEITFEGEGTEEDPCYVTITIPASRTNLWPLGRLVWDVQGTVTDDPDDLVYDLDYGTLPVRGDVTRSA